MSDRREFIKNLGIASIMLPISNLEFASIGGKYPYPKNKISSFCKSLKPISRILETEGYYVWCNSPIYGPDGKIHVFFSRWPDKYKMGGWIHKSEICHAVTDSLKKPFEFKEVVLAPRPGYFDATTCHNPHIQFIDSKYCLFYMGNSNGKTNTKRIGLAISNSLEGPWKRPDKPLLEAGPEGSWDDHCTTNPAFVKHPNGQYWLYYKSWNTSEYLNAPKGLKINGNRKYGLAIADNLEGPYVKYNGNPVIDFSKYGKNQQLEDAYVWCEKGKFKLIARDMGFFDQKAGLYFESDDGINWDNPEIAYLGIDQYISEPPAPSYLSRYGRLERPQLLMKNGKPEYLFTASQGGKYMTSCGFILKIT